LQGLPLLEELVLLEGELRPGLPENRLQVLLRLIQREQVLVHLLGVAQEPQELSRGRDLEQLLDGLPFPGRATTREQRADRFERQLEPAEHVRDRRLLEPHEPEEDVLGEDDLVSTLVRLEGRELEDTLDGATQGRLLDPRNRWLASGENLG